MSSLLASRRILRSFKPDIAIGTGGYASGPLLSAANNKGIPTLIQEQNSYPGITNRLLSKKANVICVAYDKLERFFPKDKIVKTGNPVRQDLLNVNKKRAEALKYFDLNTTRKTLLVLGGSLGAKKINEFVNDNLDFFKANISCFFKCIFLKKHKNWLNWNNAIIVRVKHESSLKFT